MLGQTGTVVAHRTSGKWVRFVVGARTERTPEGGEVEFTITDCGAFVSRTTKVSRRAGQNDGNLYLVAEE